MRSVPGANFKFEWNPSIGDLGAGNLASYFPGNAYVDYVGLDVFDVEWKQYPGARAEFEHIETEPDGLNWLASFSSAHHKPMVFPEWGLGWGKSDGGAPLNGTAAVSGGDNPVFINDMSHWFATHNVFEATYWDYGSSSVSACTNQRRALPSGPTGAPNERLNSGERRRSSRRRNHADTKEAQLCPAPQLANWQVASRLGAVVGSLLDVNSPAISLQLRSFTVRPQQRSVVPTGRSRGSGVLHRHALPRPHRPSVGMKGRGGQDGKEGWFMRAFRWGCSS